MDFPASLIPGAILWPANVLLGLLVLSALRSAPLNRMRDNQFTHVYFASCVVLLLLWNTRAGVLPALNFHLLGVTTLTLMFGWAYALLAVLAVSVGTLISQQGEWVGLGLNTLVIGVIPIVLTQFLLRFAQAKLANNFFVYIYINGFLAAGLSILAAGLSGALIMLLVEIRSAEWLVYQYFPYFPLVFFAEAFVNGMLTTAMVVMRPDWVCSFDDARYIDNR